MGIFYFPCNFVYWRKIPDHEKIKSELLPLVKKSPMSQPNREGFDDNYFDNNPITKSIIYDSIDELVKVLNSRKGFEMTEIKESILTRWWFARYDDVHSGCACHNHNPNSMQSHQYINGKMFRSTFTIVYILNDDGPANVTEFVQPSQLGINASKSAQSLLKTSQINEIGEGTVLIFPSNLYHQVPQAFGEGRVIFSFDVSSIFEDYPKMGVVDYNKVTK